MCTDKDCNIFRGMLIACDDCSKLSQAPGQMTKLASELGGPPPAR